MPCTQICPVLKADHSPYEQLLVELRNIKGINKVFVGSGLRYDLLASDPPMVQIDRGNITTPCFGAIEDRTRTLRSFCT